MEQSEAVTAPRSLKERQRQEREALILQTAEEVLMERGYYDTSIDEIASRVGVAKGTIYLHFPSKEELVIALFERDIRQLINRVEEIAHESGSARERLELIQQTMYGGFVKHTQFLSNLFHRVENTRQLKEHGKKLKGLWEQMEAIIRTLLEEGKAGGEFRTDVPTEIMAGAFFSLMSPGSYLRLTVEGKVAVDELATCLRRIYFKGIANL